MNKLFQIFRNLFRSKNELREETKTLSMKGELAKYDPVESTYHVSRHLKYLIENGQLKEYAKIKAFIQKYDPTGFVTIEDFDFDRVTVSDEIKALAKSAKLLNYKCEDEEFMDWLKSLA